MPVVTLRAESNQANRKAYTLIEMLLVIAVMSVLIAILAPLSGAPVNDQLAAAAHVVASDAGFTRDLAVSSGSSYTLTYAATSNGYVLKHAGVNPALDILPATPFRTTGDPLTSRSFNLSTLPGAHIELLGVEQSAAFQSAASIKFTSLGSLDSGAGAIVWLAAGQGDTRRYVSISIDPVLGLATAGQVTSAPPAALAAGMHDMHGDGIGSGSHDSYGYGDGGAHDSHSSYP